MISKDHLLEAIIEECKICIRLYTKLPEKALNYRPTPEQRSGLELLQYMSFAFAGVAHGIVEGNWDWYSKAKENADHMKGSEFPSSMKTQIDEIRALFSTLSDETLNNQKVTGMPWPNSKVVGIELFTNCFRWIAGYKMQLFLYAKSCGADSLNTFDCWFATEDDQTWSEENRERQETSEQGAALESRSTDD